MPPLSVLTLPDYSRARKLVRELLDEFGFSEPPVNPIEVAKGRGIDVRFVAFSGEFRDRISGFYDSDDNRIYVNSEEWPLRQTFTIAHELGHALLHREWAQSSEYKMMLRDQFADSSDPYEKEANFFAAHLLVPRKMLDKYVDILDIRQLSRLFAVSVGVIRWRIANEYGDRA